MNHLPFGITTVLTICGALLLGGQFVSEHYVSCFDVYRNLVIIPTMVAVGQYGFNELSKMNIGENDEENY